MGVICGRKLFNNWFGVDDSPAGRVDNLMAGRVALSPAGRVDALSSDRRPSLARRSLNARNFFVTRRNDAYDTSLERSFKDLSNDMQYAIVL